MGNLCALNHNVVHGPNAPRSWIDGPNEVQIAVMLRSNLFREVRARRTNAQPAPAELYRIVNQLTAQQLAEVPFPVPSIVDFLAESAAAAPAGLELTP